MVYSITMIPIHAPPSMPPSSWIVKAQLGREPLPTYAYTIGLSRFVQHELILFGLHPHQAQQVLNSLARLWVAGALGGAPLDDGRRLIDAAGLKVALGRCDAEAAVRFAPECAAEGPCRFVQVFFADAAGRLPGEPGCEIQVSSAQDLLCGKGAATMH